MVTDDRSESGLSEEFVLHNRSEERERVESTILEAIASMQYDETDRFAVRLAFEEALSNAFKHGNKGDDSKPVTVFCAVDQRHIEIEVTDQGEGFDPDAVPDPTHHENLEIPAGRGLLLMRAYMTDVDVMPPGNRIRMRYIRPDASS